MREGKVTPVVI